MKEYQREKSNSVVELFGAIINNDTQKIIDLLDCDSGLITARNTENQTILQSALIFGNQKIINIVLKYLNNLNPKEQQDFLCSQDDNGYTALHYAALFSNYEKFLIVYQAYGLQIDKACKTIDKHGVIPLQLVKKNKNSDRKQIATQLENSTFPSADTINFNPFDEVKVSYFNNMTMEEKLLSQNLKIAAIVANHARKLIHWSCTDPSFNFLDKTLKKNIIHVYRKMREENDKILKTHNSENIDSDTFNLQKLKKLVENISKYAVGNCVEYSYVVLYILTQLRLISGELFCIENGNHLFVILGRDRKTNSLNWSCWNRSTAVSDAWDGTVFPACQIPNKLKAYICYGMKKQINIAIPFQSYHKIRPYTLLVLSDSAFFRKAPSNQNSPPISYQVREAINDVTVSPSQSRDRQGANRRAP